MTLRAYALLIRVSLATSTRARACFFVLEGAMVVGADERTLRRWCNQIAAWHHSQASNGPSKAANNLTKRAKRAAFGFTSFRNYRVRSLLYAGRLNWELLGTITPA